VAQNRPSQLPSKVLFYMAEKGNKDASWLLWLMAVANERSLGQLALEWCLFIVCVYAVAAEARLHSATTNCAVS